MTTREFQKNEDDFLTFQVFRRVEGAEYLADTTRGLAKTILGETNTILLNIVGEEQVVQSGFPYSRVEDADELKLVYFERKSIPEVTKDGTFRNLVQSLVKGVPVPDKRKSKNILQHQPIPPLVTVLDKVTEDAGYIPGDRVSSSITMNTVIISQKPDVKTGSFFYDISLQPFPISPSNLLAYRHAEEIFGKVYEHARKAVYPSAPNVVSMKIASIRSMDKQEGSQRSFFEHLKLEIETAPTFKLGPFEVL